MTSTLNETSTENAIDAEGLAGALSSAIAGEVAFDAGARALYATDASNYRSVPLGVVLPASTEDVLAIVGLCRDFGAPIVSRGGGTSLAGQACGPGVVIDFSRHLDQILDIDAAKRRAVVQPGVVLESLQRAAAPHGLRFGPDPSTRDRCTFGGMIGNNSCGSHSIAFGKTDANVASFDALLYSGLRFRAASIGELSAAGVPELSRLADQLHGLVRSHETELRAAFAPTLSRRVSGYGLGHLLEENGANLARALVGSEGTCVTILEAEVHLVPAAPARVLLLLGFSDLYEAADFVPQLFVYAPATIEGTGAELLELAKASPRAALGTRLFPDAGAFLLVEVEGENPESARARAVTMLNELGPAIANKSALITDPEAQRAAWRVREEGAGFASRLSDGSEAWPGWEDPAVPPERLGEYLRGFDRLLAEHHLQAIHYGHYGEGCVHARVNFDFHSTAGIATFRHFMEQAADHVVSLGGSLSGEHGDGQARGELLSKMYPPEVMRAFAQFKAIFDPGNKMNPGRLVEPLPIDAHLRVAHAPVAVQISGLALSADHGNLAAAARRCIGVGKCRALDSGAMCPSFQVTHEERHSTRGRARLLFEMLDGEVITDGFASKEVLEALDLCLSCKACKSDCPVSVDMAAYKSVFLSEHFRHRLRPLAHYSLGFLPVLARLAARAPRLVNAVLGSRWSGPIRGLGGIGDRSLPKFGAARLYSSLKSRAKPESPTVYVWPDTFSTTFSPSVLGDALVVLEAIGHRPALIGGPVCCGRTWYSTGQLGIARRVLNRSLAKLDEALSSGLALVVLEPSCAAMLRDEVVELLPDDPRAAALSRAVRSLGELVAQTPRPWPFAGLDEGALAQLHCHEAAGAGASATLTLLEGLGAKGSRVEARCCGMAGDFGFVKGHEEVSRAVFAHNLASTLGEASVPETLLADGFSCRTQIAEQTGRRALHTAELLALLLSRSAD